MAKQIEPKLKVPKKSYKKGDLPTTADEWVKYINEEHDRRINERRKYEFQWVVNLAYYLGYQHLLFNPSTGLLELPREMKQPLTINRIGSFVESRHAKLTKNRPVARVIPNTTDHEDKNAAKNADRALMHLWRKIGMEGKYDRLIMQMLICGTAFMKNVWDPFSGDVIEDYAKGTVPDEIYFNDEGEIEMDQIFMGEIASLPLSPFAFLPASDSVPELRDQESVIERATLSHAYLETIYPHLRGELKKDTPESIRTQYEDIVQRLASPVFSSTGKLYEKKKDSLNSVSLVKTFMMKPNYQYEDGIVAVVVGDQLAMIDKFPNDFGENIYPYVKFFEKEDGFHFWNQSTIERLIPIQKAYNKLKQKKLNNASLMANGKWMLPKGSQVIDEALTDEEGEVIEYNPAVPEPHQAAIAPLPNYVSELANELVVDFRDAGGQRESSVTPPPNVTAGVAMQIAAELSDENINPIIRRLGRSMELVANQQLLLMDQEYIEPRKIKILGSGNEFGAVWMSQADFRHHTDVHIEIESMFPDFRGAKRQTLLDIWDRRLVEDPKKILKAFHYGSFDALLEEDEKTDDIVWLEIQRIKKGKEPEINPFDNHMAHVKALTQWVQSPEFLRLIPERKQLALQVLQARVGFVMQQMPAMGEPMAQQNQAAVNTPSGPAKPVGAV